MRLVGRIFRDGKFWLAEVPILDAMTQGRSREEAFEMVVDMLRTLVDDARFEVSVTARGEGAFEVVSPDVRTMTCLLLRRARQRGGRTLSEIAKVLGARSRNAYARYEQGVSVPSIEKLCELWRAACPDSDLVLDERIFA